MKVVCQVCNKLLYEYLEGNENDVSSSFCPYCYLITTLCNKFLSDRGVASETAEIIRRQYYNNIQKEIEIFEKRYKIKF